MGTPDFAIPSLDSLYKSHHNLCCVVTTPNKKQGRGLKVVYSPVKNYCLKMVNQAVACSDKNERNKMAKAIIGVMGNLNPHLRDVPDFQHKLWDQLFIMSEFNLDVDSPFPKPSKEIFEEKPERLNYPQNYPKYRFYGNTIKKMIDVAANWEDGDIRNIINCYNFLC